MDSKALIDMLNKDLAEEHAAILRYLVHSYLEGEDTPIGASLLSRSREEMWHMHWLGMIIGQLGGEPNLEPAAYPFDPASRSTIFKSYVDYEENLVPHYNRESELVDDPHISRVLKREGWESAYHAKKFRKQLDKLSPEEAASRPEGEQELPPDFLDMLQREVSDKYSEMFEHVRHAWVYQGRDGLGWNLMDTAMTKMKQLAHFAEEVAENGIEPDFAAADLSLDKTMQAALVASLNRARAAHSRHQALQQDTEVQALSGLAVSLDLTVKQEAFQVAELEDWIAALTKSGS